MIMMRSHDDVKRKRKKGRERKKRDKLHESE